MEQVKIANETWQWMANRLVEGTVFVINLNSAFVFVLLVRIKRSCDILSGISRLDNLIKLSVFQIYKDPELRLAQKKGAAGLIEKEDEQYERDLTSKVSVTDGTTGEMRYVS